LAESSLIKSAWEDHLRDVDELVDLFVLPTTGVAKTGRWLSTGTPIAFIRNTVALSNHQPRVAGGTTYAPQCTGMLGTGCGAGRTEGYTVGGTY